jgi:hypothetical protein
MKRRELVVEIPLPDFDDDDDEDKPLFQSGTHRQDQIQQDQRRPMGHKFLYTLIVILLDVFDFGINGFRATINNYVEMILWVLWLGMKMYYVTTNFLISYEKKITIAFVLGFVITECLILTIIGWEVNQFLSYLRLFLDRKNDDDDDDNMEDDPTETTCRIDNNNEYYYNNKTIIINKFNNFMIYLGSFIIGFWIFVVWNKGFLIEIKRQALFPNRPIIITKRKSIKIVLFCFLFWKYVNYFGSTQNCNNPSPNSNRNDGRYEDDSTNGNITRTAIEIFVSMCCRYRLPLMITLCSFLWLEVVFFIARLVVLEYFRDALSDHCDELLSLLEENGYDVDDDLVQEIVLARVVEKQLDRHTETTRFHVWTFRLVVILSVFWEVAKTVLNISSPDDDSAAGEKTQITEHNTINDIALAGTLTVGIVSIVLYLFESY